MLRAFGAPYERLTGGISAKRVQVVGACFVVKHTGCRPTRRPSGGQHLVLWQVNCM